MIDLLLWAIFSYIVVNEKLRWNDTVDIQHFSRKGQVEVKLRHFNSYLPSNTFSVGIPATKSWKNIFQPQQAGKIFSCHCKLENKRKQGWLYLSYLHHFAEKLSEKILTPIEEFSGKCRKKAFLHSTTL